MPWCCKCDRNCCALGEIGFYCVDCNEAYCQACSDRVHQKKDEDHSLEEIVYDQSRGVRILTLLADEIIISVSLYYFFTRVRITSHYFQANAVCPFIKSCFATVAEVDAAANALLQSHYFEACSNEHSFWRFYTDMWVRSLVTHSDSVLVILSCALRVATTDVAVLYVMIPVASCIYGLIFWILHLIDMELPRTSAMQNLEKWVHRINFIDLADDALVATLPRRRAATDLWDSLSYPVVRATHVPRYYYSQFSEGLNAMLLWSKAIVLTVRLTCIFFSPAALVVVAIAISFFIRFYPSSYDFWPMNQPGIWKFIALVVATTAIVAPIRYRDHKEMFANVKPGPTFTEQVFWKLVFDMLHVHKSDVSRWILMLAGIVLFILLVVIPGIRLGCKKRFKTD